MSVEVIGLTDFLSRLNVIVKNVSTRVIPVIRESGNRIVTHARLNVPVDTGALQRSIRKKDVPKGVDVYAGGGGVVNRKTGKEVDYAWYVEHGTSFQIAQPYFFPAAYTEIPKMRTRIMKEIKRR